MKNVWCLLALICYCNSLLAIRIEDAMQNKSILLKISSLGNHFGSCMAWRITNTSSKTIQLEAPIGLVLINSDSSHQDLILVDEIIVELLPSQTKIINANGFCIKMTKGSPSKDVDTYRISGMANSNLVAIAQLIQKNKSFHYTGQQAIWCGQSQILPAAIDGEDSAVVQSLRKLVCSQRKLPLPTFVPSIYSTRHVDTISELTVRSKGNYFVPMEDKNSKIEIVICTDIDSVVYHEKLVPIYKDEFMTELRWKVEVANLNPKKRYYMRLKINGVVRKERLFNY